ncbi:MAG: hypothetical protein WBD46_08560 [Acidobacteriaceae bacterium]
MFTYQAVEGNSKVIACDIAQYLYGGSVQSPAPGSHAPCTVENASGTAPGIILISSDTTLLSDFQLWRSDMAMMNSLEQRADQVCIAKTSAPSTTTDHPANQPGSGIQARGLLGSILADVTPAGAAASSMGTVLSMLGKSNSVMSVVGTVQDPALLNEVGRQLRALGVQVLIPEMYNPNALGPADYTHSPYMNNLQNLFATYDKCDKAKASYTDKDAAQTADMTSIITGIDTFLKSAFSTEGAEIPGGTKPVTPGANTAASQPPASVSHFTTVLAADELAREMGFAGNGANGANATWQHLVWLQALESGGSVNKQSSLFGTKVLFGGGAVDTYSVFRLDGQLVCSGNVYSFQPPVKMDDLQKTFQKGIAFDATKSPLLDSTCAALPPEQH